MRRVFSGALVGLVLLAGLVLADDHRGYLKSVGPNKLTLTVEAKDKDKDKDVEIKTNADTKFFGGKDAISTADLNQLIKGSEGKGLRALVRTKGSGPSEVATEVRVGGRRSKEGK